MPEIKTKNRIEWIDAMRAIAIMLVLLSHYDGGRLSIFANRACVQIFFFISGIFAFGGRYTLPQYVKKHIFPKRPRLCVRCGLFFMTPDRGLLSMEGCAGLRRGTELRFSGSRYIIVKNAAGDSL